MSKQRILIICNTFFQLITAIQMKLTIFDKAYLNVVLSDHTGGMVEIKDSLVETGLFQEVHLVSCKEDDSIAKTNLKHILKTVNSIVSTKSENLFLEKKYDCIIFFNLTPYTMKLFSELHTVNPNLRSARFEEGLLSYGTTSNDDWKSVGSNSIKVGCKIRQLLGKPNVTDGLEDFYCFFPELYKGKLKPIGIPHIRESDHRIKDVLRAIFRIEGTSEQYKEKYIYFSSVGDFEGGNPVGEFELVTRIAEMVGKENLLIKTHPRDETGRYAKAGFKIAKKASAPWEAIQLNDNFSEHIFLTNVSGSVLSMNLCMEDGPRTFFLYPMCDNKNNDATCGSEIFLIGLFEQLKDSPNFARFKVARHVADIISKDGLEVK